MLISFIDGQKSKHDHEEQKKKQNEKKNKLLTLRAIMSKPSP